MGCAVEPSNKNRGGVILKRFLKFLCMCLVMNMADPVAEAALPTTDLVIVSSTDDKPVAAGQMTEKSCRL